MEKLLVFFVALIAVVVGSARADEFLISHWCGPTEATHEKFAEAAEAGFNVIMFGGTIEQNKKALDLCQSLGVKALLIDGRIMAKKPGDEDFEKNLDAVVADYGSHPALWGYYVQDEPNAAMFKHLAAVNKYLIKKDPVHIPYINLFPTYASSEQLGNPTYEHHVDEFMRLVRPKLLSYDHYALLADGERADYFLNLEIIRRMSIKHKTPFNYILLSVPHGPYRNPSEADLRWQVNTALAYGARGIMYFTYNTPPPDPNWQWHSGIINEKGERDRKYYEVKRINYEIKKLAPTLMRLNSVAVYHTGRIPDGGKALPQDGLISIDGGEFVIGQFNSDDGQKYAMFVNRDMRKGVYASIRFSQRVNLAQVNPNTGRLRPIGVAERDGSYVWKTRFGPGEGRLVQIDLPDNLPVRHWEDLPEFRPRVMLNPSAQFQNVARNEKQEIIYVEGENMYDIAVKVKEYLDRDGRIDAFISRNHRNHRVTLLYETELTRMLNCDALVSLHSDATGKKDDPGGGTWTFYADEDEGKRLAECVQMPLLEAIKTFHPDVNFRGVRTHWYRLWVLHEAGCPASLTEVLFHSNPQEVEMLKNPEYQDRMAKAIAKGILSYFGVE